MVQAESRSEVVVIGGGLAGISAAADLAEAGLTVTVLEARPWLGGATCSFSRRGLTIDNGQHAFLRCCTAYRDLLARFGVSGSAMVQDRLDLTVLAPSGQARLRQSRLPAPLPLARALVRYQLLSPGERVSAAAAVVMLQSGRLGASGADATLGSWLSRKGQGENARRHFWDLLSFAATGLPADEADLGLTVTTLRTALLAGRGSADLGVPAVPLSKLHAGPAGALLAQLGVTVLVGAQVVSIQADGGGYEVRLDRGAAGGAPRNRAVPPARDGAVSSGAGGRGPSGIHADGIVLAVPAWEAAALAPAELAAEAARWVQLQPSPVISLHVVYGERVTRLPCAAVAGSPVRFVVDKSTPAGLCAGQYLAAAVPAADRYVDQPASQLRAELLPELERLFPAAAETEVQDFFVTRERRALIRQVPGAAQLRASQPAAVAGVAVAGAWTDTGWPDSMEGAVRSGHAAAAKLLADLGAGGSAAAEAAGTPARTTADGVPAQSTAPSLARAI